MSKKYSLALGWWAARWLAHIWVIKILEEQKIDITEISWTSMWAIIWALYASWKTSDEMIKIAKDINFLKLIDLDFKLWLLKWNKIKKLLVELFWDIKFEDLKIPLKIIATSIDSWERKIFEKGSLIDALRATISIPWILMPYEISWVNYVDWWITTNLPIDILTWEHIIWVSALKNFSWKIETKRKVFWIFFSKSIFNVGYKIINRTTLIMMKQNEDRSIEKAKKLWDFILIHPDFWNLDYWDFNKVDKFIEIWYNEAINKF